MAATSRAYFNLCRLPNLFLVLTVIMLIVGSTAEARSRRHSRPTEQVVGNQVALDAFFNQESVTVTLTPEQYISDLNEVIVPVELPNGAILRIEIPWEEPDLLEDWPWVTLYPREMTEFAGRVANDREVSVIEGPIGKHMAARFSASLCGNRSVSALSVIETSSGVEETEIGFIFRPDASEFVTRSVAVSASCPLLASHSSCRNHKYCEVQVGIPPFTMTISGRCYSAPWPLGGLCRCWLLAPEDKSVTTVPLAWREDQLVEDETPLQEGGTHTSQLPEGEMAVSTQPSEASISASQCTTARWQETIAPFCDSSFNHGTSPSCKGEPEVAAHVCAHGGTAGSSSCSVTGRCTEAVGVPPVAFPGDTCECKVWCHKTRCVSDEVLDFEAVDEADDSGVTTAFQN